MSDDFDPPAPTIEELTQRYTADILRFLTKHPNLVDDSLASWAGRIVAECAIDGFDSERTGRRLRAEGRELTLAEKRERGLPTRQKIGERFADALRPAGLADPMETARAIAHFPTKEESRAYMRNLIVREGTAARMMIIDDSDTCDDARLLVAAILPGERVPEFPLPDCDKLICRCAFDRFVGAPAQLPLTPRDRATRRRETEEFVLRFEADDARGQVPGKVQASSPGSQGRSTLRAIGFLIGAVVCVILLARSCGG